MRVRGSYDEVLEPSLPPSPPPSCQPRQILSFSLFTSSPLSNLPPSLSQVPPTHQPFTDRDLLSRFHFPLSPPQEILRRVCH